VRFEEALDQLPVEKKTRRLKVLWPLIEAKLAEGVSHAVVLDFLSRNGFDLTEGTYKNYLHRFRKTQQAPDSDGGSTSSRTEVHSRTVGAPPAASGDQPNRPATFDYDPLRSGIAIDEQDPIMAVLVASAEQTEEIGARLLNRTSPVRIVVATAVVALVFAAIGASAAWYAAQRQLEGSRAEWL
jgi:hypothetical protein